MSKKEELQRALEILSESLSELEMHDNPQLYDYIVSKITKSILEHSCDVNQASYMCK